MEQMDIVGKTKEDASLPKATMTKIIKEMLPPDVRVARDTQDLLIECCVEFINLISSESNEVCNREDKRTIAPEHVLKALEVLGFGEYIEEVYAAYEQHKLETVDTVRAGKWGNNVAEMTEEEALAAQQRMFAEARARMNGVVTVPLKQQDSEASMNGVVTVPPKQQDSEARMNGVVTVPPKQQDSEARMNGVVPVPPKQEDVEAKQKLDS
ncbi:protein Dr1 homolog isoform X2 [Lycium barbarum]|uniref:protein Dr1 homolog isoform X2 n=1 Tax=Lycium barbarum TaxID=112863 RepID=UPI00293EBFE6|nr:protein Dr1 homolog isoform X2 [Lycium barbarum]XP_060204859.1 protein Dr1 homolog isoform X2 [Lycium barbarum]XP_060204860.1 protein Dr1 homolog isoform X2 [Lycium barbarum]XP_060204861.1 protein Dr1 homolog isoform X2 [Lycium barbarum]